MCSSISAPKTVIFIAIRDHVTYFLNYILIQCPLQKLLYVLKNDKMIMKNVGLERTGNKMAVGFLWYLLAQAWETMTG
jgi:hypothetical protein